MSLADPADKAADQFRPVANRRAGYSENDAARLEKLIAYFTRQPDACGHSGEAGLLVAYIHHLREELCRRS